MVGTVGAIGSVMIVFGLAGVGIYLFAAGALSSINFYGANVLLTYLLLTWNVVTFALLVLAGIGLILLDRKHAMA